MRKIDAFDKEGNNVALLKETAAGWSVFDFSNRQTYAGTDEEWSLLTAKNFVRTHICHFVEFKDRNYLPPFLGCKLGNCKSRKVKNTQKSYAVVLMH